MIKTKSHQDAYQAGLCLSPMRTGEAPSLARLRDNQLEVSSVTTWPWYWEGEKPGTARVPQLKRGPGRDQVSTHLPTHPGSWSTHGHTARCQPAVGKAARTLPISTHVEGGTWTRGARLGSHPLSQNRQPSPRGRVGRGKGAAFTGSSALGLSWPIEVA